tara:strand:- start:2034 stop:2963 length:930 start_codon:yes stop_codon:yes gene_type:complete
VVKIAERQERAAAESGSGETTYSQRARYFDAGAFFKAGLSPIPAAGFVAERDKAFDPGTGTKLILVDQGKAMNIDFPATTPLILAAYARVQAGDVLTYNPCASTIFGFVIKGDGQLLQNKDKIGWATGDIFCLPGGVPISFASGDEDSILWLVSNEPQFSFERCGPPEISSSLVKATHFPANDIGSELGRLAGREYDEGGSAVILSSEGLEQGRALSPTLTLSMNQLRAGANQPPHRHNSVAVSLIVNGANCYSMVDGVKMDWLPWSTVVTPPGSVHSHHNEDGHGAHWLIVQDGGLYNHCRTMGFSPA